MKDQGTSITVDEWQSTPRLGNIHMRQPQSFGSAFIEAMRP